MKRLFFVIFSVIVILAVIYKLNTDPKNIIAGLLKNNDIKGDELRYKIYLLGIVPVADAIFLKEQEESLGGRPVYHLRLNAKSAYLASWVLKASVALDSYINRKDFSPVLFRQQLISPGKERKDKEVIYDQNKNTMTVDGIVRQIEPNTHDPLSLIFSIRRLNMDKAKDFEMDVNTNQKNYVLKANVKLKDLKLDKTTYGIAVLKGEIKRRDKNPYHQTRTTLILLTGQNNLPVLIRVFASGLPVDAKLIEIK